MGDPLPGTAPRCDPRGWGAFVSGRGCRRPHCAAPSLLPSLPPSLLPSLPASRAVALRPSPPGSPPAAGPGVGGRPAPGPSSSPPFCGAAVLRARPLPPGLAGPRRDVLGPHPGLLFGEEGWGSRGRRFDSLAPTSTSGLGAGAPLGQEPSTPGCCGGAPVAVAVLLGPVVQPCTSQVPVGRVWSSTCPITRTPCGCQVGRRRCSVPCWLPAWCDGELLLAAPGKGPCSSSATRTVSESRKPGDLVVLNVPGPGCAVIKCISSIVSCLVACAVKWPCTIRGGGGLTPAQPPWLCSVAFFPLR